MGKKKKEVDNNKYTMSGLSASDITGIARERMYNRWVRKYGRQWCGGLILALAAAFGIGLVGEWGKWLSVALLVVIAVVTLWLAWKYDKARIAEKKRIIEEDAKREE